MGRILLSLLLICGLTNAYAQRIYTWVDDNGVTHYDESPHGREAKTLDLQITRAAEPPVTETATDTTQPEIIMYGAAWCSVCKQARRFFRDHDVRYTEYDVETSSKGKRDYRKLNGTAVPIFLVDGRRYNGFAPSTFTTLLDR